jgi:hypothetical protein
VTLQGREWGGGSAFKKGSIPQPVDKPRSPCDHHALSPSGPPDGVRRCSLEGSVSRSSLPATPSSESVRLWWCRRSCLLPAAIGGVQPHGGWHPFATIRLQGFSSRSPAAVPRRRPPRRMTTSLVVGRSKSGCGLSPTLSFKDVHHPCYGGRQVEPGPYPPFGLVTHFFLQYLEGKGVHQSCGGGGGGSLGIRGRPTAGCQLQRVWPFRAGWLCCCLRRCLMLSGQGVVAHSWLPLPAGRTGGPYNTSYAAAVAAAFLDGLVLTPVGRNRGEDPFVRAEAASAHRCRGGRRRWRGCPLQGRLPPLVRASEPSAAESPTPWL